MLILVGVTINIAINGGIFERTKSAADQTQREADREELLSSVYGTLGSKGNLQIEEELENNLSNDWDIASIENNDTYLKCTSPKKQIFYVNIQTGEILNELPKELNLNLTSITLEISGTENITVQKSGSFNDNVTWQSSNTAVATVEGTNNSATVTAVAEGTAVITATCDGITTTCTVTVGSYPQSTDGNYSSISAYLNIATMITNIVLNSDSTGTADEESISWLESEENQIHTVTITIGNDDFPFTLINQGGNDYLFSAFTGRNHQILMKDLTASKVASLTPSSLAGTYSSENSGSFTISSDGTMSLGENTLKWIYLGNTIYAEDTYGFDDLGTVSGNTITLGGIPFTKSE